jgi:hypothetical protein
MHGKKYISRRHALSLLKSQPGGPPQGALRESVLNAAQGLKVFLRNEGK